eukprot:TRINITY_DN2439_c0_g3_i6.p1 TRINITY_DN2439_c0_g3~~TRINITY_DN2439_c0_g3_i6.p1  ORF type:complete len:714 (-),score=226.03 TRINITY_DN2439_c0_g3_i6:394-2535(-)
MGILGNMHAALRRGCRAIPALGLPSSSACPHAVQRGQVRVVRQQSSSSSTAPGPAVAAAEVVKHSSKSEVFESVPVRHSLEVYRRLYNRSITDSDRFWSEQAKSLLHWSRPFERVCQGNFADGDVAWFTGGTLNAAYNCVDRHLPHRAHQTALIYEGDELGEGYSLTYHQLHARVCRVANALLSMGVRRGDVVTLYMPTSPDLACAMLACARIGATHSVVFAGFSAGALRDRLAASGSRMLLTCDVGKRGGKTLELKKIVDEAVGGTDLVHHVGVFRRDPDAAQQRSEGWEESRDVDMNELLPRMRPYCAYAPMEAEDPLFILYTSGSTGKPKGLVHTTGGYLLQAAMTTKNTFDLKDGDVFGCVADVGWITGHTYCIYGPLLLGATSVLFESTPRYPHHGRYWDLIDRHRITQFYTSPTAIRTLMKFGTDKIKEYKLDSLRVLGSVGEPINPEAWTWYFKNVGHSRCTVVDTWWQTETGGHMMAPMPGMTPLKPGSCTLPVYGVQPALLDPLTGEEIEGNDVEGLLVVKRPWPGMARTIHGDHHRYMDVYFNSYRGYYATGDGARRDENGYYWITGRVDDVVNVAGHRIGTAEVESSLASHNGVSEAAVVGFPDPSKGQGLCCYVTLNMGTPSTPEFIAELKAQVRRDIGPFATPDVIVITPDLPKTRSGKIMRRILRKLAEGEPSALGDTSTLADPSVVERLVATQFWVKK